MKTKFSDGYISVGPKTKEWHWMWNRIGKTDKEKLSWNDECGEGWQYQGTWKEKSGPGSELFRNQWFHQFRHRAHPKDGKRKYVDIPVSDEFKKWIYKNEFRHEIKG